MPLIETIATGVVWEVSEQHAADLLATRDVDGSELYRDAKPAKPAKRAQSDKPADD